MAEKVTATVKKAVATPKVEVKVEDSKAAAKKETVVKAAAEAKTVAKKAATEAKTVAKKAATETKTVAKKAATGTKTTAKKAATAVKAAAPKKVTAKTSVTLEYSDKKYSTADLEKIAADVWVYDYGKKASELKTVDLYVKPFENRVYYVFNGDILGSFQI